MVLLETVEYRQGDLVKFLIKSWLVLEIYLSFVIDLSETILTVITVHIICFLFQRKQIMNACDYK